MKTRFKHPNWRWIPTFSKYTKKYYNSNYTLVTEKIIRVRWGYWSWQ